MLGQILKLYNYYFSRHKHFVRKVSPILGFIPIKPELYIKAFSHKSLNGNGKSRVNNERLEYLGDAILSTIVADYLFKKYPNKDEGFLTKMRSKIVKRKTLNDIAAQMGLDLILSEYSNGRLSKTMMGNSLEAMIGAHYLESGYKNTKRYVIKHILMRYLDIHLLETYDDNYKSKLLEWCQKKNKNISFETLAKFKYDKRDRFKVAVVIDGQQFSIAEDFNKKSAEQAASQKAIKMLIGDSEKQ